MWNLKGTVIIFFFFFFALSAPVVSPTDVAGYGGRNGEIVITWTVRKLSVHVTPKIFIQISADNKPKRCVFFFLSTPDPLACAAMVFLWKKVWLHRGIQAP